MAILIDPATAQDVDQPLNTDPDYSTTHVFSTNDVTGTFGGLTQGDVLPGDPQVIDFSATPKVTTNGEELYPINSEFGFIVTDFDGAVQKDFADGVFGEGWAGDITDSDGTQIGLVVSDSPTDTFQTPAVLGTWLSGLGGNSVKASTEHYNVMQQVLSDQAYPDDPDAVYALDNNLIVIGGEYDGLSVSDLVAGTAVDGNGDPIVIDDTNFDGVIDIKDILDPNESTITENIAASTDYSVTVKDDGKLLYRWGNMIKRPNDVRLEAELELPDEWSERDSEDALQPLYRITSAELVMHHTITNNPNDQIRPEDYENEAAIGTLPTYEVISDYNEDGEGPREVWVSTDGYYAGDGTFYEAGTVLKDANLAALWDASEMAAIGAKDGAEGFTNAWYTTMDREPFEPVLNDDGTEYEGSGPRWRLLPDKYGQDLPGVVIPIDPSETANPSKDQVKYEVGAETQTVINLLDWATDVSPMSVSAGWQNLAGSVSVNGLNMTENFDMAVYIKGDIKPATIYSAELVMDYEEIAISDVGATITGGAGSDYLVGQGDNLFNGGAGSDLFVASYGAKTPAEIVGGTVIQDFTVGEDVLGLIGIGADNVVLDTILANTNIGQTVVAGGLSVSVDGVEVAFLEGLTEALGTESFYTSTQTSTVGMVTVITGTDGADLLEGDDAPNTILGLAGDDTISGLGSDDTIWAGEGDDIAFGDLGDDKIGGGDGADELWGGEGNDVLYGELGDDTLGGGNGNDEIGAGQGNDVVYGGAGDDILNGYAGNDTIGGGEGDDRIAGGTGSDMFVFSKGQDTITDFDAADALEQIDLGWVSTITDFIDLSTGGHMSQVGSDVVIDDLLGNTLTLTSVSVNDLSGGDFLF